MLKLTHLGVPPGEKEMCDLVLWSGETFPEKNLLWVSFEQWKKKKQKKGK